MIYQLAHEIRNPLGGRAALRSSLNAVADREMREYTRIIIGKAIAGRLTESLLGRAQPASGTGEYP